MTDLELYELYRNPETREKAIVSALNMTEKRIMDMIFYNYKVLLKQEYKEDVLAECKIAVLECLKTYDPEKSTFWNCCYLPVKHKICVFISENIFMDTPYRQKKYGKTDILSFEDVKFNEHKSFEENSVKKLDILKLLDKLNSTNRRILIMFYIERESIKTISKKMNLTERSITARKEKSLLTLRKMLSNY